MFNAKRLLLQAAVVVAVIVAATVTAAGPARAAGCTHPTLTPAERELVNGDSVLLAGTTCGRDVQIMIRRDGDWQLLNSIRTASGRHFAKRVKVRVAPGIGLVELRAVSSRKASRPVRLRVEHKAASVAPATTTPVSAPTTTVPPAGPTESMPVLEHEPVSPPEPPPIFELPPVELPPVSEPEGEPQPETPEPEPPAAGSGEVCPLAASSTAQALSMAIPSCPRVASDTTSEPNPLPFWGSIDCAESSRYATIGTGGDEHLTAEGSEQGNSAYRRLTVENGDEFYGSRCELGFNNHERGPTAFYREGDHRVTYFSERLPSNFPLNTSKWQTVMQMKQAEPMHDDGSGVSLEMQVMNGRWYVLDHWNVVWSFPAQAGVWTRFAWDVYYSNDPSKGWLQVSADLNGDGDFEDPGERSPVIHGDTLATEIPGYPSDGITPGTGIPSHLRMGIYHNPEISCPAPTGCSIDVDNVQVVAP